MNLILTTDCNKGCRYCFAKSIRRKYSHSTNVMHLDDIKKILDNINNKEVTYIKLLGGEPTLHPDFSQILDEVVKRGFSIALISNFLFSEEIRDKIIEMSDYMYLISANATNLDEKNLIHKWSENYNIIHKKLQYSNREKALGIAYTFENNKSAVYYIKYTNFILQNIDKIERIRLSIAFPWRGENNFYFINNKELGDKFLLMTKKAVDIGAILDIDCVVYPCIFSDIEEYEYIKKHAGYFASKCENVPMDILPDRKAIYCFPLAEKLNLYIREIDSFGECEVKLKEEYKQAYEMIKLPTECNKCTFYKDLCDGPCLGFFKLE